MLVEVRENLLTTAPDSSSARFLAAGLSLLCQNRAEASAIGF